MNGIYEKFSNMDAQAKLNVFSKLSSFVSNIVRSYNRRENGSHQRFRCVHIQNLRRKEEKKKKRTFGGILVT